MSVTGLKAAAARFAAAAGLVCGLLGLTLPSAQAASWVDPYLDQMVSWGIMRGDINGNLEPDRSITRAEFVTMVNRAYGYTEMGPNPYKDVASTDWFYEDICIARNVGYFSGMSSTEAAPRAPLTREQAAMLIGKNMMLSESTGETLGFNDSRQFSDWSRHMIDAVAQEGVISGYTDGSFRPQRNVTRGEVAVMLSKAIGTPIQQSGVHSLGGVYGNLTINTPGVTLKDTVVYGDLYVSGGIGLSSVELENVRVLGKIVVSGTGESEKGEHSVLLRNVTADELVLDSMANQFVTLKSEGFTSIAQVNVRTSSYLEDVTDNGYGLTGVTLDGEYGTSFQLAGNIKDVLNVTPGSTVTLAQGVTQSITIDEKAIGSQLNINNKAMAGTVNLDTAVKVEGTGDITHMNVNAAGSSSVMLPDTITVRPGITADVYEEKMDSVAAQESSAFPRLLSGYPAAENISPKATDLVFKTNKKGTIYWAVTALADGTVEEDELLNPPTYGGTILKSGTITATGSNTPFTAKVSGLTTDGSYYVSAMLVDNRGMRSPVKITAFTTPDDTTPAFASGYPTVTIADGNDNEQIVQALVMPNKNCRMYYALLPKGSTAPKAADFKANAVTGNLGYGIVDVQKNTPYLVSKVNTVHLEEETEYDLYLWLTDVDGAKSSAVKKVTAKTLDRTPPHIQHLTLTDVKATSVTLTFALNEPGTFYWAVKKHGEKFLMDGTFEVDNETKMAQIVNGTLALKNGSSSASKASTDVKFTISGLEAQTAYDVYFVAKDKADKGGNFCVYRETLKPPMTVHTLDNQPPTVSQVFTNDASISSDYLEPYPDTTIRLEFSENVQGIRDYDLDGEEDVVEFLNFYKECFPDKMDLFGEAISQYITLYPKNGKEPVIDRNASNEEDPNLAWVIDYRKVRVEMDGSGTGELIITFPYNKDSGLSALNLVGGETYYFKLRGIADTSNNANKLVGIRGETNLQEFTVRSAYISLSEPSTNLPEDDDKIDKIFLAQPNSHEFMDDDILWDMIFWSSIPISFNLYESIWDEDNNKWGDWTQIGSDSAKISNTNGKMLGCSIGNQLRNGNFEKVKDLTNRMYGIGVTSINGDPNPANFTTTMVRITTVSGGINQLQYLGYQLSSSALYADAVENNPAVTDITSPVVFSPSILFPPTAPNFMDGYPTLEPDGPSVTMGVILDRMNTDYYYVLAPVGDISPTTLTNGPAVNLTNWDQVKEMIPESGQENLVTVTAPSAASIMTWKPSGNVKSGKVTFTNSLAPFNVADLAPDTQYLAYFVLSGGGQYDYSEKAYIFRFKTGPATKPAIQLYANNANVTVATPKAAEVRWVLHEATYVSSTEPFNEPFIQYIDGYNAGENHTGKCKEFADKYPANMTVLQAIERDMGGGDFRSVFDVYADITIHMRVRSALKESAGAEAWLQDGWVNTVGTDYSRPVPVPVPETVPVDAAKLSPGTKYCVIVAALNHNTTDETLYGFKAIRPVQLPDNIPPHVTNLDQNVSYIATTNTVSGKIGIKFDDVVYLLKSDKTTQALSTFKPKQLKGMISTLGATVTEVSCNKDGDYLTITFENLGFDEALGLFQNGVISDIYGNSHSNNGTGGYMTLRPAFEWKEVPDPNNPTQPKLELNYFLDIKPESWLTPMSK